MALAVLAGSAPVAASLGNDRDVMSDYVTARYADAIGDTARATKNYAAVLADQT